MVMCGTAPTVSHWVALCPLDGKHRGLWKGSLVRMAWLCVLGWSSFSCPRSPGVQSATGLFEDSVRSRSTPTQRSQGSQSQHRERPNTADLGSHQCGSFETLRFLVKGHVSVSSPLAAVSMPSSQKLLSPKPLQLKQVVHLALSYFLRTDFPAPPCGFTFCSRILSSPGVFWISADLILLLLTFMPVGSGVLSPV